MKPSEAQGNTYRQSQLREELGQGPKLRTQLKRMGPRRGEQLQLEDLEMLVGQCN